MSEEQAELKQEEKEVPKSVEEIRKSLKTKNLVFGTERTLKLLRNGKLSKVYIASNVKNDVGKDIEHYTKTSGVELVKLEIPNEELGTFCKKTYSISVIGMLK